MSPQIELQKGDITTIGTEAIVNAANSSLLGGGGVDGAIHRKGGKAILDACIEIRNKQGGCATGEAVVTTAGNLPSQYVIHTVGPVWNNGHNHEAELLKNCYRNSLKLADNIGIKSISFPNISTGIYHYPKSLAAHVAIETVKEYIRENTQIEKIVFVCFDDENYEIYDKLMQFTE